MNIKYRRIYMNIKYRRIYINIKYGNKNVIACLLEHNVQYIQGIQGIIIRYLR